MRTRAILVAVLLVLAGCSAPTTSTPTPTPTDRTQTPRETTADAAPTGVLAYDDATLDYNGTAVLERVERLRDLDATGTITVTEFTTRPQYERDLPDSFLGIRPPGAVALGLYTNATVPTRSPLGLTYEGPFVRIRDASDLSRFPQELVFAHELTHALQYQQDFTAVALATSGLLTTDRALAVRGVVEGDAQLTAVQYRNRYSPDAPRPAIALGNVSRARWQYAFSSALYHYGYRYYQRVGTSPAARNTALRAPPNSTRSLLHPSIPVSPIDLPDAPQSERYDAVYADRVGELGIRLALRANGVPKSAAADAAFGWTNGRMTYYAAERDAGVRWLTAWTNRTEAREFAAAWRAMLSARNATRDDGVLVVPATDTTPRFYTAVDRTGSRVLVTASLDERTVRALAHRSSSSRNRSISSSTSASSTTSSASFSASLTSRSPDTSARSVSSSASTSSSSRA